MFPVKGEGGLRAACWQLDEEGVEKAEPGLPGMPAGCGSVALDAVIFLEYSNVSLHFICSDHSLPPSSTLHLSEEALWLFA